MTEKIYEQDAYQTTFTARVLSCAAAGDAFEVVLERTLFYPEGGGQPADRGILGGAAVLDVQEKDGIIRHKTDKPLPAGETVAGEIDWAYRFDLMQNHSGEHILSGVICGAYGCDNVGFHMGRETVTIDLNHKIPAADLPALEERANEAIWRDVPVEVRYPSPAELDALAYRSKKELAGQVRIVRIGAYDCCACCGTHVRTAGEIGQIKILGAQNYKGGTRIELVCGARALRAARERAEAADAAGRLLSMPATKVDAGVAALLQERDALLQTIQRLKQKQFAALAAQVPAGTENVLCFADGLSSKDLAHFADLLRKNGAARAAVFSPSGEGFAFVLLSGAGDARGFAEEMKAPFGCKGGGKPDAVQGRVGGERAALAAFFAERGFFALEG